MEKVQAPPTKTNIKKSKRVRERGGETLKNIEEIGAIYGMVTICPLIASTRQQTLATFEIDSRKQKPTDVRGKRSVRKICSKMPTHQYSSTFYAFM